MCWVRENCIRLWGWIVYELGYTECEGCNLMILEDSHSYPECLARRKSHWVRSLRNQLGMWHSEDLAERWVIQRSGCLAGRSRIVQTPFGCGKLHDIIGTERLTCTERILRPDAGMVIQHALIERSHAGWLEGDSWNMLELGPRGAIIAKRSGYCTTIAYVPPRTQF